MRNVRVGLVASMLVSAIAHSAAAQTCVGTAAFSSGPVRIGAAAQFTDHAKAFGGSIGAGAANGLFADASVARTDYDDISDGGTIFGATAGWSLDLNPAKTLQFCPLVSFDYQSGPDIETGLGTVNLSAHSFGVGGSIGGTVPVGAGLDVVPFAGAQYTNQTTSGSFAGQSGSTSDDFGLVRVGAGFVVNRRLTLQPSVTFPVGLDGAKPTYGISMALNFGSSTRK